eukprot:CAMPEP_0197882206 /NCGR_PEP_ID=MMETSP1439-20131203/9439_1 /TAXON_ID=66791 /ORGANISM="Gonyaulax spinifera, Strain CCMP409" /LENGTH=386 /DNA_ID=CAMNT_0043501853 /DNA_START=45 /DNA_END=1203 /DNA_ORIENTATION=-
MEATSGPAWGAADESSVEAEAAGKAHKCSKKGDPCTFTGCCDSGLTCVAPLLKDGVPGKAECKKHAGDGEFAFVQKYPEVNGHGDKAWEWDGRTCHSRFVAPAPDRDPTKHNGVTLPDVCIKGSDEHHVFIISDWGGVENDGSIKPADVTKIGAGWRQIEPGVDDKAQVLVAKQMQKWAAKKKPDYVINAGSSLWGGIRSHCGPPPFIRADTGQWKHLFEDVYKGDGLDGKQWLGVLGYQDYGGQRYVAGWDQTIGYTWGGPGSTGRWMLPAQYYRAVVRYIGFVVEYYFIDTSTFDSKTMCNPATNKPLDNCGAAGPKSVNACKQYFKGLWDQQLKWLDGLLKKSNADWQIVVTNIPPWKGTWNWAHLSRTHGIDLFISGNKHEQ